MHPSNRYIHPLAARAVLGRHVRALPLLVALTVGVACGVPLGLSLNSAVSNASAPRWLVSCSGAGLHFDADASVLEPLRTRASSGDTLSSLALVDVLLDRFDSTADPGSLYEAMIWIDRRWLMSGEVEAVSRVQARYCGHPVVQWHLLCHPGE